jgi:uncharacterized protein (DUF1778 family)
MYVYLSAMATRNITITLDVQTLEWVKEAAAAQGKSVSRFLGDMAREHLPKERAYWAAYRRWQESQKEWSTPLTEPGEKLPTREEIYAERLDHLLRRR